MGFKDIVNEVQESIDEKVKKYEENFDEDEIPPWYGNKEQSTSESNTIEEDTLITLNERDSEQVLEVRGYDKRDLEVVLRDDVLEIRASEENNEHRKLFVYNPDREFSENDIRADYSESLLEVHINLDI